ncbi:MAG: transposase [Blastocatellia bacterium]|nr:transposase [Blastocatellia bacterium]
MYDFRRMSPEKREEIVDWRKANRLPWHSPPHGKMGYGDRYLVSAACYEHQRHIGASPERMTACEKEILSVCRELDCDVHAWCILPNHYHLLLRSGAIEFFCEGLGKLHGRLSRQWNEEESRPGRKIWYRCFDREMRSQRHFHASLNYVHHNPVRHGYVEKWTDWPWSSASLYLEKIGREEAERIWLTYPIRDYGKKWDLD